MGGMNFRERSQRKPNVLSSEECSEKATIVRNGVKTFLNISILSFYLCIYIVLKKSHENAFPRIKNAKDFNQ
jgi:hypothetical protein